MLRGVRTSREIEPAAMLKSDGCAPFLLISVGGNAT